MEVRQVFSSPSLSSHFTGNSPLHKLCRMFPSGTFLLLPPQSSLWPPGFLAATTVDLWSNRGKQQGRKPSREMLVNSLDGLTPDAARPIRRQWFIWCFSPSVMKRESMGSSCRHEGQGAGALPAPPSLGTRLEIELEPKGPDSSFLGITHITLPERKTGLFSPPSFSRVSLAFKHIWWLPPPPGEWNLNSQAWAARTFMSGCKLSCQPHLSLASTVTPTWQSHQTPLPRQHESFAFLTTCFCKSHFLNLECPALPSPYQSIKILHERPRKMSCPHYKTFLFPLTESNFLLLFFFLFYSTWTWGCVIVFLKSLSLWDCELIPWGHPYLIHLSPPQWLIWSLEYLRDSGNV